MISNSTLKQLLEKRSGHGMTSPADCEWLAHDFQSRTHLAISVNTLKRLLGFLPYDKTHRTSTLDVVARYLGYDNFSELENSAAVKPSNFGNDTSILNANELAKGSIIEITYKPDRNIRFQYQGDDKFVVTHSMNSQLQENDIAVIRQFVLGYPLIATTVMRNGNSLGEYTAARIGGLTSIRWRQS